MKNIAIKTKSFLLIFLFHICVISDLSSTEKHNVLILYADDLGFGDLTCYNTKSKIPTPELDKLAQEGMLFTDGHSSSGVCTPSRYALLTGRFHWRKFYGIVNAYGESVFSPERLTLPEMMQEMGYKTAAIGKWHLGWGWKDYLKPGAQMVQDGQNKRKTYGPDAFDWTKPIPNGPNAHGFDYYFGDAVINFPPYTWIENDKVTAIPTVMMDTKTFKPIKEGHWECRGGPMVEDWDPYENIPVTTQKGVEYIHKMAKDPKPFFLYFAYPSPHAPIIPNDEFDGKSEAGPYGDFIHETDHSIGQLINALKESGQYESTIIIFSADNGPEAYAYSRELKYGHWSSYPLRGLKQDLYEGGHRVPFIIRWPGITENGSINESIVSQVDIMASLASYLGYELPDGQAEDSLNLMPLLAGKKHSVRNEIIHNTWENTGFAIRQGDWVLINEKTGYVREPKLDFDKRHDIRVDADSPVELYNLKEDIGQKINLANKYPKKVSELKKALAKIRKQGMAGR